MVTKTSNKNWYQDKYQSVLVQRNILAFLTLIIILVALFALFLVSNYMPLKSVEPFVIQVDERSGITEVVDPKTRTTLSSTESLDNYFIWQYVKARETYDAMDAAYRRGVVRVLSNKDVFDEYYMSIGANNPNSSQSRLGNIGRRVVDSPTIVYLNKSFGSADREKKVAQVRFTVKEFFRPGAEPSILSKIALVEYEYYKIDLARSDRLLNPIGFQVINYRLDEEVSK